MEYHKIHSLYKRGEKGQMLFGEYSKPEFEYLKDNIWVFDEKVDGTNIRIIWDGVKVTFGGKTDKAQIPAFLVTRLMELTSDRSYGLAFTSPAVIYGEGYGAKIQKVGGNYNAKGQDFIVFDIFVGNVWLKREVVREIASSLGLKTVPIMGEGTLVDLYREVEIGITSTWGDFPAEGIVARPKIGLRDRMGNRIITKLKGRDFQFPATASRRRDRVGIDFTGPTPATATATATPPSGEDTKGEGMLLTEKETKEKVCCGPYSVACMLERNCNLRCIASDCMAWRWLPKNEYTPMNDDAEYVLSGYYGLASPPVAG